jgi:hypothetical protein
MDGNLKRYLSKSSRELGARIAQSLKRLTAVWTAGDPILSDFCRSGGQQPPIQGTQGTLSPRVKRLRSEAGFSPTSNSELKMAGLCLHSHIHLNGLAINYSRLRTKLHCVIMRTDVYRHLRQLDSARRETQST